MAGRLKRRCAKRDAGRGLQTGGNGGGYAGPARAPARSALRIALSWVRDLAFSVLIAVVLIVFIYQPVKVEGTSMEPSLTDQERIFINKFTYRFRPGQDRAGRYGGVLVSATTTPNPTSSA